MGKQNILRMMMMQTVLLLAMTLAVAAEAKEGLYLGVEMVFADLGGAVNSEDTISSGDGGGITAGYGVSRFIAFEVSFQSSEHSISGGRTIDLTASVFGVKATLPIAGSHIEPYLAIGVGKYTLDTARGEGWRYGAGMDVHLSPAFSLTLGVVRDTVDFGPAPRVSGDVTSMNIGIAYNFR